MRLQAEEAMPQHDEMPTADFSNVMRYRQHWTRCISNTMTLLALSRTRRGKSPGETSSDYLKQLRNMMRCLQQVNCQHDDTLSSVFDQSRQISCRGKFLGEISSNQSKQILNMMRCLKQVNSQHDDTLSSVFDQSRQISRRGKSPGEMSSNYIKKILNMMRCLQQVNCQHDDMCLQPEQANLRHDWCTKHQQIRQILQHGQTLLRLEQAKSSCTLTAIGK
ncbi:hypothetical protein BSL78_21512 [Apostichopus japonicus]|uniref:Uncharacterized protein n=1 Tax=Stichopus japonicus TaxID=307972 RepID=A0A2G8K0W6_STIJA|nr:hypothetical protein BSL78_21512 [Apostichopus japonicus]